MKKTTFALLLLAGVCSFLFAACTAASSSGQYITTSTPPRAAGQQSVLGLRVAPIDTVRVGFIGLGMRGPSAVERFTHLEGVKINALCDLLPENVAKSQQILSARGSAPAAGYSGEEAWRELCCREDIDLVYICTPWQKHVEMAVYAMEQGKHVAVEVPAATSLAECWALVDTAERTQRHCMMLENCVYDFFEMTVLNMAQQGLFGELLMAEGAYIHNLDPYWKEYQGNWRMAFNQAHRGDVYATHGLGPICQLMDIHRGDRMTYLVAMDTPSINGLATAREQMGAEEFANGDHTLTLIKTERGRVIHLQHNVYTPRPYNRLYQLTGTRGFANKYPIEGFAFDPQNLAEQSGSRDYERLDGHTFVSDSVRLALMEQYAHPIIRDIELKAREVGGHGGMDFIMDYRLIYCLRNGLPLDQDVYDAAEWSAIGELTALSLQNNSAPVQIPDFTRGDWQKINGYRHAVVE